MSIFRRDSPSSSASGGSGEGSPSSGPSSSGTNAARRRVTHIAPGTRIRGELTGATELLIEGEVEGEVRIDSVVVVGTEGVVQGPVVAQTVRVSGKVVGNIQASERVEIAPAGSLEGDIAAPRVVIAEGAFFKGRVEMMKGNQEREARRPKASGEPRNQ
ncbi:MAG TPA: polymer-forming cytoskeletal protein [Thermoanaerobaculia bacterium]|nr:polymer-forming cytoskeletal protein [Thermoanaerobaculia bacterium]